MNQNLEIISYKYNLIRVLTRVRNYDKSLLLNQKRVNKWEKNTKV